MSKKVKGVILIFFAAFVVVNFAFVGRVAAKIGNALYPVFIGLILALMLNAPVKLLEKSVFSFCKQKKVKRVLALSVTLTVVVGVIFLLSLLIAPEVVKSIEALKGTLKDFNAAELKQLFNQSRFFYDLLSKLEKPIDKLILAISQQMPSLFTDMLSTLISVLIGIMFGLLIIVNKESLYRQVHSVVLYFFKDKNAQKFMASMYSASDKFSKFMAGQILEALIFGTACYLVFLIFSIPYPALIALIMAVVNLIPILGAYLGGAASFIIIMTVSPEKALIFLIIIIIMQQVEQFTTYPIIVGKYVGLSAFWVMFAVSVGGALFGFWGLLLAVPLLAFAQNLFKVLYEIKRVNLS